MKTILFSRNGISPRLFNEGYALAKVNGFKPFLDCKVFDEKNMGLFKKVFTLSVPSQADIINCCGSYPETEHMLKNTDCPVVMDLHNGTSSIGIDKISSWEQYKRDKYCFEHVSGILYRGSKYEIPYYIKHGYKIKCPVFVYKDYCNKLFFSTNNKKLSDEDGEIHICDMGGGYGSPHTFLTIRKFIDQKIHFHLYLPEHVHIFDKRRDQYILSNKNYKYFHLEDTLPFHRVPEEISKYDFGSIVQVDEFMNQHNPSYLRVASAYRIYTYMDAGLPFLVSNTMENIKNVGVENNTCIPISSDNIKNIGKIIQKCDYDVLRKNVLNAREKLDIGNYAEDLVNFYDSIQ